VVKKAAARAFKGGAAGFAAGVVQVITFMWLRTSMNYQYANGGTLGSAIQNLAKEGGIARFYRGVNFAILQAPLSRFGDTAANTGVLAFLEVTAPNMPVGFQTAFASTCGALWRIAIMPIDAYKTTLQVRGKEALSVLKGKVASNGPGVLYYGAVANFSANWVGNYPWFVTHNFLQQRIPQKEGRMKLVRNAFIGICSSSVSDTVSNSLRVLKTVKQTSSDAKLGYVQAFRNIVATEGVRGLLGRGLATRLLVNVSQSMVFTVLWKSIQEELQKRTEKNDKQNQKRAATSSKKK
jgi:hypothetical protein